ncbi:hypothetical protein JL720_10530 [Aureococcus anophagefferens]|nr:hypothetical protein JL720_10530 [Aureococcus anophagefferens]
MDSDSDDASLEDEEAVGGRSRDLLSSFYGKMASDVAPPEEEEDEALDPIDREDFDAETRTKFIGATDTIRDMKDNVGGMEGEMTSLSAAMADIDATSAKVNASLADKRSQIDKLVRARRLLKRLEFLFELPKKLAAAIADGRHGEAVTSFQAVDGVLRKYAHVPSLADIHAESAAIVAGLRDALLEELARRRRRARRRSRPRRAACSRASSCSATSARTRRHPRPPRSRRRPPRRRAADGAGADGAATLEGRVAALTAAFVGPYGAGAAQLAKVAELTDARLAGVAPETPRRAWTSRGPTSSPSPPSAVAGDGDPPAGRPEIRDAPRPFAGLAASAGAEPPEPPAGADAAKGGAVALAALCRLLGDASPGYGELAAALLAAHVDLVHGDVSRRYAQLERDARYLHAVLPSHVPDADTRRAIELAVADFLQGASDRCLD